MYLKYGLEKEFFLLDPDLENSLVIPVPKELPFDESGFLVEARGKPYNNIREAVFSLLAEIDRMKNLTRYLLDDSPFVSVTKKQKLSVRRSFAKGTNNYQNIYGYEYHKTAENQHTAGVHISFTNEVTYTTKDGISYTVNKMFDFVQLFRYLDKEFSEEIKQAKRRPGFYEIKGDGRIEYRSLPSNVSLDKIIKVVDSFVNRKEN